MAIYLYCLSRSSQDRNARGYDVGLGVGGTAICRLPLPGDGPLEDRPPVAWVSALEQPPAVTAAHVGEHDHVCDTILAMGDDVLPARFGQLFEDAVALEADYRHRNVVTATGVASDQERAGDVVGTHVERRRGGCRCGSGPPADPGCRARERNSELDRHGICVPVGPGWPDPRAPSTA